MSKIVDNVTEIIREPIEQLGYELVDVEYKKESVGMVLTVYIDKREGVNIDDCELVSKQIDPILDEHDPIPGSYCLSVSSPGIDRPLKTEADFKRKLGTRVTVKLYAPINKKKEFDGELVGFDKESVTIRNMEQELVFSKADIAVVKPWVEF